jgi:hypothetical protein
LDEWRSKTPVDLPSALSLCTVKSGRTLELQKLTEIFLGKAAGTIFCVILLINLEIGGWSMAQTAAAAWASNLPVDGGTLVQCSDKNFLHQTHPSDDCWNSYVVCLVLFGIIAIPLTLLEMQKLKALIVGLILFRVIVVAAMLIHSTVIAVTERNHLESGPWTSFNMVGWFKAISVFVYGLSDQLAVATLVQPISDHHNLKLHKMFIATAITCSFVYGSFGIAVSYHFESNINEIASLNWLQYTTSNNGWALRVMAYCIILLPSFDGILIYIFGLKIMTNNVESWLFENPQQVTIGSHMIHLFVIGTIPLIGAIFVSNLVTMMQWLTVTLYIIGYIIPAVLQYQSQKEWRNKLSSLMTNDEVQDNAVTESSYLLNYNRCPYYDTPYSGWYSRPTVYLLTALFSCVALCTSIAGAVMPL